MSRTASATSAAPACAPSGCAPAPPRTCGPRATPPRRPRPWAVATGRARCAARRGRRCCTPSASWSPTATRWATDTMSSGARHAGSSSRIRSSSRPPTTASTRRSPSIRTRPPAPAGDTRRGTTGVSRRWRTRSRPPSPIGARGSLRSDAPTEGSCAGSRRWAIASCTASIPHPPAPPARMRCPACTATPARSPTCRRRRATPLA